MLSTGAIPPRASPASTAVHGNAERPRRGGGILAGVDRAVAPPPPRPLAFWPEGVSPERASASP